jgi:hypothetical protein
MLSSQKQLQLQKHTLQGLKSRLDASSPSGPMPVSRTPSSEDAFENVLDPKERFEYMVRESPLSKALTASPFDYTEKEFRDVFGVIAKTRPESVMVSSTRALSEAMADAAVIEGLTKALGAERYEMLRRARDPSYSLLRRIADLRGISRETIDQAYAVLVSTRPAASGVDPAAVAAPPEALSALLGPDAAADVHRAFTYSRQAAGPGGPLSQTPTRLPGRPLRVSPAAGSIQ